MRMLGQEESSRVEHTAHSNGLIRVGPRLSVGYLVSAHREVLAAGVVGGMCPLWTELLCAQNSSVEALTPSAITYGGEPSLSYFKS